ncbi:hypothetical protein SprV_1002813900 [Sparganum proliferum]
MQPCLTPLVTVNSFIVRDACHQGIMELTHPLTESSGKAKSPHDIPQFVTIHLVECFRQIHERRVQVGPHLLMLHLQLVNDEDPAHDATITANVSEYFTGNAQRKDVSVVVAELAVSYPFE